MLAISLVMVGLFADPYGDIRVPRSVWNRPNHGKFAVAISADHILSVGVVPPSLLFNCIFLHDVKLHELAFLTAAWVWSTIDILSTVSRVTNPHIV